jgi:phosphate:Na+ symporter
MNSYHYDIMHMIDLSIEYLETFNIETTHKIMELEDRINQQHLDFRKTILTMIQTSKCDAESGLNAIDYFDTIEILADKLKNIVKAGRHNFIYPKVERIKFDLN